MYRKLFRYLVIDRQRTDVATGVDALESGIGHVV